ELLQVTPFSMNFVLPLFGSTSSLQLGKCHAHPMGGEKIVRLVAREIRLGLINPTLGGAKKRILCPIGIRYTPSKTRAELPVSMRPCPNLLPTPVISQNQRTTPRIRLGLAAF